MDWLNKVELLLGYGYFTPQSPDSMVTYTMGVSVDSDCPTAGSIPLNLEATVGSSYMNSKSFTITCADYDTVPFVVRYSSMIASSNTIACRQ